MENQSPTPNTKSADKPELPADGCYAVIAYRWGWKNHDGGHVLKVTTDLEAAQDRATAYTEWRGGKYGCEVVNHEGERVFYSPSLYGEDRAHINERICAFEKLGQAIYCEIEDGREVSSEFIAKKYKEAVDWKVFMEKSFPA
jgi:hypothetical protein